MKLLLTLFLSLFTFCNSSYFCTEEKSTDSPLFQNTSHLCPASSPLASLLQKYPTGHPYRNVNIHRDISHFNPFSVGLKLGRADKYVPENTETAKGQFGKVFRAYNKDTKKLHALKVIDNKTPTILREIQVLQELKDAPNFLPIKEILVDQEKFGKIFTLVFDYFQFQSFRDIWYTYTKTHMKKLLFETFKTLDYIHSKGIMHRDMKHSNVLWNNKTFEVRMIDFGQGEYYLPGKEISSSVGTLYYKAPELFLAYHYYDYSIDIWSAGVMLGEMMFKKQYLFQTTREQNFTGMDDWTKRPYQHRDQLDAIASVLGTVELLQYVNKFKDKMSLKYLPYVDDHKKVPWKSFVNKWNTHLVDANGLDLLGKLLVFDHTKRITAKEAMNHPFFDEVRNMNFEGIKG